MAKKKIFRIVSNWNGKTSCDYFIHILRNPVDVNEGDVADVKIADCDVQFEVRVEKIIKTRLEKLTDLVTFLSMGQNKAYFADYMQRAYKDDIRMGYLYLYLFHRTDRELPF